MKLLIDSKASLFIDVTSLDKLSYLEWYKSNWGFKASIKFGDTSSVFGIKLSIFSGISFNVALNSVKLVLFQDNIISSKSFKDLSNAS